MKGVVILTIACVAWMPDLVAALNVCQTPGMCPANADCPGAGTLCQCNEGFHENNDSTACEQDITPGNTCTQQDSDRECVDGATCANVTDGQTQALQCTCREGYTQTANVGEAPTCKRAPGSNCTTANSTDECVPETTCRESSRSVQGQVHVQLTCMCGDGQHLTESNGIMMCKDDVKPGGNCTTPGEETECVDNASCVQEANQTKCTCNPTFHASFDSASCQPDVPPNSPCQIKNSNECVENAVCQNTAGAGLPEVLQCVCPDTGFHVVSVEGVPSSCEPDIQPGGNCSIADSATECLGSATCVNMTSQGGMTCVCDAGYHSASNNTSGDVSCEPDVSVGGACAMNGSDVECVEGARCLLQMVPGENSSEVSSLQCTCTDGYHEAIGNATTCELDKGAGSTCERQNSSECVAHAECQDVAQPGEAEALQCVCVTGYHRDNLTCQQNFEAGQPCSQVNSTEQCVEHSTCVDTQSGGGNTTDLKCMCDADYHETHDASNRTVCAEDTCLHTKDKCTAAGMTTCDEVDAFISCMLAGKCDAADSEQVAQFHAAMMEARDHITEDCNAGGNTTCEEKVTSCLTSYLKANTTCDAVEALGTCLADFQAECQENTSFKLTTAFKDHNTQLLSCVCEKASVMCLETQTANYNASGASNATKCSAVKELFTCALDDVQCDVSKPRDHEILSALWSEAMTWSSATGCKDTLENADSCPLKLTRCALIYADGLAAAADNKTMQCRSAETFGSCIMDNSTLCNQSDTTITLFREQYTLISGECLCITKVTECEDAVGILSNDPVDVCPKLETLGRCLFGSHCQRANDDDDIASLDSAHDFYTKHRNDSSCKVTSDGTCSQDLAVCADTLITKLQAATSATQQCTAITESMLCIYAANCSDDDDEMTSSREAAKYRLQSLACTEPTCNVTFQALTECKVAYEANFTAAGTDDSLKCTAKNNMVRCLRSFQCNTHMNDVIQQKYDALKNVSVPKCELLSLEEKEETSTAPAMHTQILLLLVCLLVCTASKM